MHSIQVRSRAFMNNVLSIDSLQDAFIEQLLQREDYCELSAKAASEDDADELNRLLNAEAFQLALQVFNTASLMAGALLQASKTWGE